MNPSSEPDIPQIDSKGNSAAEIFDAFNVASLIPQEPEVVEAEFVASPERPGRNSGDRMADEVPSDAAWSNRLLRLPMPPIAIGKEMAAMGGVVGSLTLGILSVLGSLITAWSAINGMLGIALGIWGLTSRKPRWAIAGIVISVIGIGMSALEVSEHVSKMWISEPGLESDLMK